MAADLLDVFERWRATKPRHRAHTWLDKDGHDKDSYTLQELWTEAGAVAAAIRGVEVAILCYPPGLEFLVAFYGCLFAGVAAAPCYPPDPRNREARTARHFETIIEASGAQVILTTAAYLRGKLLLVAKAPSHRTDIYLGAKWLATDSISCEGVPPLKPPPSLAFLQYTSGSTSAPKGVMVGRRNLAHNLQVITEALDSNEDTVCVSWLPQYHDMGLVGSLLGTLYCGGTGFHSSPLAFVRDPTSWLRDMTAKKATHTQAPSFAYGLAARKYLSSPNIVKVDLSTLKHATNGAEPIRAADVDTFAAAFERCGLRPRVVVVTYGLAEHVVFVCRSLAPKRCEFVSECLARDVVLPGKGTVLFGCGRSPGVALAIVREGRRVNGVGEVWVRSASRAVGYWRDPQRSAETFGGVLEGDDTVSVAADGAVAREGWLRTGDLGFLDEAGDLFVCAGAASRVCLMASNAFYAQAAGPRTYLLSEARTTTPKIWRRRGRPRLVQPSGPAAPLL